MTTRRYFAVLLMTTAIIFPAFHAYGDSQTDAIEQSIVELNQYVSQQQSYGLQDPNLAYAMRKGVVLATLLLDSDGTLNTALCPALNTSFVPEQPLEYEANIGRILDLLDSSWQAFFDGVVKPVDSNSPSNLTVRALLSLPNEEPITDYHAKVAVLASMFAPYNQGPVGDCFATADMVRDHYLYYTHAADDYAALVKNGYLTRLVDKHNDNFFYVATIADGSCGTGLSITSDGNIVGSNLPLLSAPGLAAAASLMVATASAHSRLKLYRLFQKGALRARK